MKALAIQRLQMGQYQCDMDPFAIVESRGFDALKYDFIFWKWYKMPRSIKARTEKGFLLKTVLFILAFLVERYSPIS